MVIDLIKEHYIILFLASFFLGLDKGGLKTLLVVCMYLLTFIVDSKLMLAILAPIMVIGDIIPIIIYKRDINKKAVFSFMPFTLIAIIITGIVLKNVDAKAFTLIIGIFILVMAIMMSIVQYKDSKRKEKTKKHLNIFVKIILAIITGISAMSNSAAAITNLYFFNETENKKEFIGSSSQFFFFINALKLLVIAFIWKTISIDSLLISLA
ncbi:MAG: sulfite exporter TauE/SafE family protein, partial [Spirochaetaceae bacterium]|nr:sulfite exporter TauE/SafE family protein [Spirochaetaceae bacterium]